MNTDGDGKSSSRQSLPWRVIRFFDPAEAGFLWRMARLGAVVLVVSCCALSALGAMASQTRAGRYGIIVALDVAGDYDRALAWTDDLLADYPTESWDYYRTKAYILRYMGRSEESLAVYDQAIEVFPDEWWAYSHKCYYTALLTGDPIEVMDACDRSIELGPTWPSVAYDRRAIARALIGDLTGAEEDMARGLELASADDPSMARDAVLETRPVWLAELRAGRNPIGEEEIEFELARH